MRIKLKEKPELRKCDCGNGWMSIMTDTDCNTDEDYYYEECCAWCNQQLSNKNDFIDKISEKMKESEIGNKYDRCNISQINEKYLEYMKSSCYLVSDTGRGKTWMMVAKFKDDIEKNKDSAFTSVTNILLKIKSTFNNNSDGVDILNYYSNVNTLYLDDLGVDKVSEFVIDSLNHIIDNRYNNNLKTIISSNLMIDELSKYLGGRIASRIYGMCKVIKITGEDRRLIRPGGLK